MSRQQSQRRIEQLLDQYPFLLPLYAGEVATYRHRGAEVAARILIQRGDANLLFTISDNVSGNGQSLFDPKRPGLKGTQLEYFVPVSTEGRLGRIRDWSRAADSETYYVRDMFNRQMYDWESGVDGQNPFEVIDSIVWVRRETWYPGDADLGAGYRRPEPVRREVYLVVYQAPRQGWLELFRTADPLVNVKLFGWQLLPGANPVTDPYVRVIYDRMNRLAVRLQERVWDAGLGEVINTSPKRSMVGVYGSVMMESYIIAGRLSLTMKRGNAELILVGFDDEPDPRLSLGSIYGTARQAEAMIREVIKSWEAADEETRRGLHRNTD